MSERTLSSSPRSCSGEQKAGVPRNTPVAVNVGSVRTMVEIESPKSPIFTAPPALQVLGLKHRAHSPFAQRADDVVMPQGFAWLRQAARVRERGRDDFYGLRHDGLGGLNPMTA